MTVVMVEWSMLTHCLRGHEYTPENTYHHPNGSGYSCKECRRTQRRQKWQSDPEWAAAQVEKRRALRYGVSIDELRAMLAEGCAICGTDKSLHIDHNHATGKNRKVLCHYCNTAIGLLKEDPALFAKALEYLKEN